MPKQLLFSLPVFPPRLSAVRGRECTLPSQACHVLPHPSDTGPSPYIFFSVCSVRHYLLNHLPEDLLTNFWLRSDHRLYRVPVTWPWCFFFLVFWWGLLRECCHQERGRWVSGLYQWVGPRQLARVRRESSVVKLVLARCLRCGERPTRNNWKSTSVNVGVRRGILKTLGTNPSVNEMQIGVIRVTQWAE